MPQTRFQALFLGDSIVWGQGLREEDKFSTWVVQWINQWHPHRRAYKIVKAHSGAIVGDGGTEEDDPNWHPEMPCPQPSIHRQCASYSDTDPSDVDLVVINGGINDVGVRSIFNPNTSKEDLRSHMRYAFLTLFPDLLASVARKFANPATKILVLGYYPILSDSSSLSGIAPMASLYGVNSGNFIGWNPWRKVIDNAALFYNYSDELFEKAIAKASGADAHRNRIILVKPFFRPQNAAFAAEPWVFGIRLPQLIPEDDMAEERQTACLVQPDLGKREFALRASIGHPNRWGARAYFNAIYPVLQREYGL
jgi:lysophospholipase L1-like esterase